MRKIFSRVNLALLGIISLVTLAAGCHGDVNELDTPVSGGGPSIDNGLRLSVDKTTIEADGKDYVTFSLKLDGVELTASDETLQNVYFKDEKSGQRLEKWATTFSAVRNGDYSFVATYKGQQSANSVHVKAVNREKYEPYGHRILVYDLTGTWCGYCPSMTAALENVAEDWRQNMIVMAVHTASGGDDPYALGSAGNDLGSMMLSQFGGAGYPTCIYDLAYLEDERTASGIGTIIQNHIAEYPATCGVKIISSSLNEGTATINAEIHSPAGGEYELGYVVLRDNERYAEGTAPDGIYNDIVCAVSTNFNRMTDRRVTLEADGRHTESFEFHLPAVSTDNLRVVVFALGRHEGEVIVDNANVCPLGEGVDYNPVEYYDGIPEAKLTITADRTTIKADGEQKVTFKVMYGSEDVSNARTMNIIRQFNGEHVELSAGTNQFATTVAGTYTFKARYYIGGEVLSENEVIVTATAATGSDAVAFRHKLLGMQFTSIGCPNCPALSETIKIIQSQQPDRLVPVSFHLDYQISDPMHIEIADLYYKELKGNGLPMFYLDLRDGEEMTSSRTVIESEMAKIVANYPSTCGVAISTSYNPSTRNLSITPRIKSNTATSYRYLIFLVEDGIQTEQYGKTGLYTHANVVRKVLSDNIYGSKFNGGVILVEGEDTPLSSSINVTLDSEWNAENMRVVVSALSSVDGGATYTCNNTNECEVGGSIDYSIEDGSDDGQGGGQGGGGAEGDVKQFNRHVSVFEFTGITCSFCPAGYVYLKYLIEDFYDPDQVHILAFHENGDDPMGTPLTTTIYNAFKLAVYPSFVVDMREAFDDKLRLEDAINSSFENYPATCGIKVSNSCNAAGEGNVNVELWASKSDTYRLAVYILEDDIIHRQYRDGLWVEDYRHHHVVRTLLSSIYEGDRMGEIEAGMKAEKSYQFQLDSNWVKDNCSICALVIDGNGYVNNVAVCPIGGSAEYDYAK